MWFECSTCVAGRLYCIRVATQVHAYSILFVALKPPHSTPFSSCHALCITFLLSFPLFLRAFYFPQIIFLKNCLSGFEIEIEYMCVKRWQKAALASARVLRIFVWIWYRPLSFAGIEFSSSMPLNKVNMLLQSNTYLLVLLHVVLLKSILHLCLCLNLYDHLHHCCRSCAHFSCVKREGVEEGGVRWLKECRWHLEMLTRHIFTTSTI